MWLSAQVDGRLAPRESGLLADHVSACADCRGRSAVLRRTSRTIAALKGETEAPQRLRRQAEAILLGRPALPAHEAGLVPGWWLALRRRWFYLLPAGALAGFVALAGFGVLLWMESRRSAAHVPAFPAVQGPDDLAQEHARLERELSSNDRILSTQPATVAFWFARQLRFPIRVPRVLGASLLGGRIASHAGRPVAHLHYEVSGLPVSVFLAPTGSGLAIAAGPAAGRGSARASRDGIDSLAMGSAPQPILDALVSDRPPGDLP